MEGQAVTESDVICTLDEVLRRTRRVSPEITPATTVESLDLESLEWVEFFMALEDRTGCAVVTAQLPPVELVRDLVDLPRAEL
jgi:acyl carrier protein